jgi:hypothetical protein
MITVHKLDHLGREKIAYTGEVRERTPEMILLVATFVARERLELGYVTLTKGDVFVEWFYSDRWYNIFAIFDATDGAFKGWYCNLTRPARFERDHIWAEDLALDYFMQPHGAEFVLDEAEFAALGLAETESQAVRAALAELQALAARREGPFDEREVMRFRPS